MLRTFAIVVILTSLLIVIPVSKADGNTISLHITHFDDTQIIDIPFGKKICSIVVVNSVHNSFKSSPPEEHLFTTNEQTNGSVVDPVNYEQYTAEVLKEGPSKHLYIYVPSVYYKDGYRTQTESLDLQITLGDDGSYAPLSLPETTYEYVVITSSSFWSTFNTNFKQWKIDADPKITGMLISNVSAIVNMPQCWVNGTYGDATDASHGNHWVANGKALTSHYSMFNDTQAKIRNYIRYCYDNYGTRYVLLAGDRNVVPPRIMFNAAHSGPSGQWYNYSSAVDMYYSCLDGNWNNNTNSLWGEARLDFPWCHTAVWDDIDWGYDVSLGRLLVGTVGEANAWITRLKEYVAGNEPSKGNYLNCNIIAGKNPSNQIDHYVWDQLSPEFPSNLSFVNNYTISQAQWSVMDDYCNGMIPGYDGIQLLYHSGHGGTEYPYAYQNLNNSDRPQIFYSEGCQTVDFGSSDNSRMELLFNGPGGFVCGISNSAYGWFEASTWYSKEMFYQMFTNHEYCFARANDLAREIVGHTYHSVCSQLVKGLIFCGDPALDYNWCNPEPQDYPPVICNPNPINGSLGENISFIWHVGIFDAEGQQMTYSIQCDNGQSASGSSYNATVSLSLSGLQYMTLYTVWVNVSDGTNSSRQWYQFTTKPTPSMMPENNTVCETVYNVNLSYLADKKGDVSFYWGDGSLITIVHNVSFGQVVKAHLPDYISPGWLCHNTTYYWYVIDNGTRSRTCNFHTSKAWDCDENNVMNYLDVSIAVSSYFSSGFLPGEIPADIMEDGVVNYLDMSILAAHYRDVYMGQYDTFDTHIFYVNKAYNSSTPGWGVTKFNKIQEAVNISSPYYFIYVHGDGDVYNENVLIQVNYLNITGNYTTTRPRVNGQKAARSTIEILADWVNFSGFYIDNTIGKASYHGISVGKTQYLMTDQYNVTISNCYITQANWGVLFRGGGYCTVENCEITTSVTSGVYPQGTHHTIINNYIHACSLNGVDCQYSSYILIKNNIFTSNTNDGVKLSSTNNDTVRNNNFTSNGNYGVEIGSGSNDNWVYHNNFVSNHGGGVQARQNEFFTVSNHWNLSYPFCGNYWSDHHAQDIYQGAGQNLSGADGIVDSHSPSPYNMSGIGQDIYPFYAPYHGMNATSNYGPIFSNEQPGNGTSNRPLAFLWNITINDGEGNSFNWTIQCSNGQHSSATGASNGTKSLSLSGLAYSHTYRIWVNATDSGSHLWTRVWYVFVTMGLINHPPNAPSVPHPLNNTAYIDVYNIYLNCTVSDPDGDMLNIHYYWGNGTIIGTISGVANNTVATLFIPSYWYRTILGYSNCTWLTHDTIHSWYAIADDGINTTRGPTWNFHTGKAWDLNVDGQVNYLDVSGLVGHYENIVVPPGRLPWDINEDTLTNYLDVSSLVSHYGQSY